MGEMRKTRLHKLLLFVSYLSFVALVTRTKLYLLKEDLPLIIVCGAILLLIPCRYMKLPRQRPGALPWVIMFLFTMGLFFTFRNNWLRASSMNAIVSRYGIPYEPLVYALAVFGCLISMFLQWKLLYEAGRLLRRIEADAAAGKDKVGKLPMDVVNVLLVLAVLCIQHVMLQIGVAVFPQQMFKIKILFFFTNLLFFLAVNLVLVLIVQRWRLAVLLSTIFFTVWGIANHYVCLFHGEPLLPGLLASAGTAMDVLSAYSFTIDIIPWTILAFAVMAFRLVKTYWVLNKGSRGSLLYRTGFRLAMLAAAAGLPILAVRMPATQRELGCSQNYAFYVYGAGACVVQDTIEMIFPFSPPDGYSADRLPEAEAVPAEAELKPDIILILNETFCDLDDYSSVKADRDYMSSFYQLDGAAYGHAIVPLAGGGTNNSEYELLTANSMYLIKSYAPFNFIDFTEANSNVVQYLKRLGYVSCAMHYYSASNYSRDKAYPAMGFNDVELGGGPQVPVIRYGERGDLDSTYYGLLEKRYESYSGDEPRFLYMLTVQNHGGYGVNDDTLDTVHTQAAYGDLTSQINEYMTSIAMSCDAFKELTEYFSQVDRLVIICMVGDHAPTFLSQLEPNQTRTEMEDALAQRTVPYVIWSNYGADLSRCGDYTSVYAIMPEVIRSAGLPLTAYYEQILALREVFLATSAGGICLGKDGAVSLYDPADTTFLPVTEYYYMEYNALRAGEDYREELFLPAG